MEITGKIIRVLPVQKGVTKSGKEFTKQSYVLEYGDRYPKKFPFELFGAQRVSDADLHVDDVIRLLFDIDSNEWNGKWYPIVSGYKVEKQ
ncbi:hypothetical protein Barb4_01191 [Bacteroidales bacterium Barb4]|nr:hypothetical protein Barb4_01191 [Bacteroidales bacterium Barb4]